MLEGPLGGQFRPAGGGFCKHARLTGSRQMNQPEVRRSARFITLMLLTGFRGPLATLREGDPLIARLHSEPEPNAT